MSHQPVTPDEPASEVETGDQAKVGAAYEKRGFGHESDMVEGPGRRRLEDRAALAVEDVEPAPPRRHRGVLAQRINRGGEYLVLHRPFPTKREIRGEPPHLAALAGSGLLT